MLITFIFNKYNLSDKKRHRKGTIRYGTEQRPYKINPIFMYIEYILIFEGTVDERVRQRSHES